MNGGEHFLFRPLGGSTVSVNKRTQFMNSKDASGTGVLNVILQIGLILYFNGI